MVGNRGYVVEAGEAKSASRFAKAVEQLGIRVGVVGHILEACAPTLRSLRKVGRIFVPRGAAQAATAQLMAVAEKEWDFSLYIHEF
jgi:hypothetical protein